VKKISDNEYELTDVELIVRNWHDHLLDMGMSPDDALAVIEGRGADIAQGLKTGRSNALLAVTQDADFRRRLVG
jgi:hypothetical protein